MLEAAWVLFREGLESLLMVRRVQKNRWLGFFLAVLAALVVGVSTNLLLGPLLDSFRGVVSLLAALFLGYVLVKPDKSSKVAFFSVFREGMEAALFYTAILRTTPLAQLVLGAALGALGVLVAGVLIFKYGVRSEKFILTSTVALWWLAVKFAGVAVVDFGLAANYISWWPYQPILGAYPFVEVVLTQLAFFGVLSVLKWKGPTNHRQDSLA